MIKLPAKMSEQDSRSQHVALKRGTCVLPEEWCAMCFDLYVYYEVRRASAICYPLYRE